MRLDPVIDITDVYAFPCPESPQHLVLIMDVFPYAGPSALFSDALAASSDDPDYAAQLAHILADAGRDRESRHWRQFAAERYDELLVRHSEAFADHAAEFWLGAGADPDKALRLATVNLEVRNTPRARSLLARAVAAKASFQLGFDFHAAQ